MIFLGKDKSHFVIVLFQYWSWFVTVFSRWHTFAKHCSVVSVSSMPLSEETISVLSQVGAYYLTRHVSSILIRYIALYFISGRSNLVLIDYFCVGISHLLCCFIQDVDLLLISTSAVLSRSTFMCSRFLSTIITQGNFQWKSGVFSGTVCNIWVLFW